MSDFETTLRAAIEASPVYDPHSHLRAERPQADHLADIVLYHHVWIELVSAGMPPDATSRAGLPHEVADPGMEPLERVRAALPYLHHLRGTTCGNFLRVILRDLYGLQEGRLAEDTLEQAAGAVAARATDPAWLDDVLQKRCGIRTVLTVEHSRAAPCAACVGRGREGVPTNLISGKQTPAQTLASIEERLGCDLGTGGDLRSGMHRLGQEYSRSGLHFAGVWLLPQVSWREPSEKAVTEVLARARRNAPLSPDDLSEFTCLGLDGFVAGLREGPLRTIQLILGAEVLPPHRSITHWDASVPGMLARLAGAYPDFHFNCSTASEVHIQDLAIVAKHVPNVSVAGYWWHTIYPHTIRKSLALRLDMVPANKIVAFFSDAYHAEWCYPKLRLVRRLLGDVLLERVSDGTYTPEAALSLVPDLMHDNAARIYGLQPPVS
ncbi:MAG: hypothetical protein HPY69_11075 [Armatimonadetes bacterium]|nr:hypothetical protein [Armatimonadota bacterium]